MEPRQRRHRGDFCRACQRGDEYLQENLPSREPDRESEEPQCWAVCDFRLQISACPPSRGERGVEEELRLANRGPAKVVGTDFFPIYREEIGSYHLFLAFSWRARE